MDYDLTYDNNYNSQKYIDLFKINIDDSNSNLKDNFNINFSRTPEILTSETELFNNKFSDNRLLILQNKITELQNKIEFCKLYSDKINIDKINQNDLNKTIALIDSLSLELNKNIINKGQFKRKSKSIEFEF
jgi:hypothetical protein